MWRMHDGDRVLTDAEWAVFAAGLDLLRDWVEQGIRYGDDDSDTGVGAFDRLTAEQKLGLLAEVASAVRDPAVPMPAHTAANEGAIMAVLVTFKDMLRDEVRDGDAEQTGLRASLLAAVAGPDGRPERLPEPASRKWGPWDDLYHGVVERLLWDYDFDMGDAFLDLPPDEARAKLGEYGIDPDYYLDTPAEPDEEGLIAARRTLARLLGLAVPGEDGLFPMIDDLYHGLWAGPVAEGEAAAWADHPWVRVVGSPDPGDRDCDYPTWRAGFGGAIPPAPFRVCPAGPGETDPAPEGRTVERFAGGWAVRDPDGFYWCDLVGNGWTGSPEDDEETPPLVFPTEADARAAFAQANRMYGEREARYEEATSRLGSADQ